jgi:hypothetical protein
MLLLGVGGSLVYLPDLLWKKNAVGWTGVLSFACVAIGGVLVLIMESMAVP